MQGIGFLGLNEQDKVSFNDWLMESETVVNTVSGAKASRVGHSFATYTIAVSARINWDNALLAA